MALSSSNDLTAVVGGDLLNVIVDNHKAPMIVSSIMKQNCTKSGREYEIDVAKSSTPFLQ